MRPVLLAVTALGGFGGGDTQKPAPDALDDVGRRLVAELGLAPGPTGQVERCYLDTFDWRLVAAGRVLEHERVIEPTAPTTGGAERLAPGGSRPGVTAGAPARAAAGTGSRPDGWLRLRALDSSALLAEAAGPRGPQRADDLPESRLREQLRELTGGRALLAVATTRSRAAIYRRLDEDGKTVGRVVVSEDALVEPSCGLGLTVLVAPVRGYGAAFGQLVDAVTTLLGGDRADDPMLRAARAAGHVPGRDPSAFVVPLPPGVGAADALRRLLGRILSIMVANEPGVSQDLDPEFLHDLRVAARRGRVVLDLAAGVLPEDQRTYLADELRWLGRASGTRRDLDVLLADLGTAHRALDEWRGDLAPLLSALAERRAGAQRLLAGALGSGRWSSLLEELGRLCAAPLSDRGVGGRAGPSLAELASRAIRDQHRTLVRRGRSASTEEAWHDVRKLAKRQRYVIEAVRSMLDDDVVDEALAALRSMQAVLGEAQDRTAHALLLHEAGLGLAGRAEPLDDATARAVVAAGGLVEWQRQRRRAAFDAASTAFAEFDAKRTRRRIRRVWEELARNDAHADGSAPATGDPAATGAGGTGGHARDVQPAVPIGAPPGVPT